MKWSPEIQERFLAAVRDRLPGGKVRPCPLCGNDGWFLADGFVQVIIQPEIPGIVLGGETLPSFAIVCKRCGSTQLLNVRVLGLDDLLPKEVKLEDTPDEMDLEKQAIPAPSKTD